ncbi:chlorohydrolase [Klebsiella pneumoniae]|nr:chlorohydrolase [Klebsiella pneumoniae]
MWRCCSTCAACAKEGTCGGRAALKALLLNGRPIVEDDAIPGLDLDAMRHDALAAVRTLQQRAAV